MQLSIWIGLHTNIHHVFESNTKLNLVYYVYVELPKRIFKNSISSDLF